ncbi:phosphotransferase [Polyangium sp. 6x1]|uniref:phosphotransferase enzyme family protein n=1 Tax=Polyangium sp. 6x1 TaxID=3042689 RepID=UPI002482150B|nr:phosphotransferase [Polyangium sp. 6x1]MDI1445713.1 phosphotransferase [Polyangium sp. 6x1]
MESIPAWILARYRDLDGRPHALHGGGLINRTFLVEGRSGKVIVQRLHPVFAGVVNEDIDAVTAHLAEKGLLTPRPVRTDDGALWVDDEEGRAWRALSFVEGQSHDRIPSPSIAREAGRMVARFHAAVADLAYDYRHVRAGVHDTKKHLATLEAALDAHTAHRLFGEVEPLARRLLAEAERLPDLARLPLRHVHGDLKISNLLFQGEQAACLVDLDTLGRMIWPFEMGDALRSWCNPAGEDVAHVALDAGTFGAALAGYGEVARGAGLVSAEEAGAIVDGLATICLELSARFLADALREVYFGFDARRFPARGEHNLVRGKGQLALFDSVQAQRTGLEHAARLALG